MYQNNLTEQEKKSLINIVELVKIGKIDEEFYAYGKKQIFLWTPRINRTPKFEAAKSALDNLVKEGLIAFKGESNYLYKEKLYKYKLNNKAYQVVEFLDNKQNTYITNINNLDNELKTRCLSILSSDISDSKQWDSAVRTAGVILEERLRQKGNISDRNIYGRRIVDKIIGTNGTLANKFTVDSERQGYRDLYAGIIGAYRNPSAHRLIDPTPEEGGTFIMFVDLLLKKLDKL